MQQQLTDKEIIDGNALIAEFMGSKYINEPYKAKKEDKELTDFWHWSKPNGEYPFNMCIKPAQSMSTAFMIGNFFYHISYDWIMPACKRFDALNLINHDYYQLCDEIDLTVSCYEIILTFKKLVNAIKWYNKQK